MKSMTGFGTGEFQDQRVAIVLELKSYNNRYLDIVVNVPQSLGILEQRIREYLKDRITRGRVEVYLRVRELISTLEPRVDHHLVEAYAQALKSIQKTAGIRKPPGLEHLLQLDGVVRLERTGDPEDLWPGINSSLEQAYLQFDKARVKEGNATLVDIKTQTARIHHGLGVITGQIPQIEDAVSRGLRERFSQVLGDQVEEQRLLAETASLLVKHSINEEVARIESHLSSMEELLAAREPAGKRLDFICQELNREINTIGSKSFLIEISQTVVQMKDALENIREQLRNLE
ncbi:YicC/YloC family endoribonuclease [Spirochaeta lutea]|uniref:YicC family protein n=1 Tax=Spirochaeta lutea TaxID=1480694 RepID=A0A098QSH1_9SPIO|nr:YicC/YloC family endoribonuclease [Spirochaeta lutea]KGE70709.1 hypothetical protein DC28_14470 [Spirochaeta lutea]